MITFPTSSDIYIEINGKKLAVAQSYRTRAKRESRYVEAFGSKEPVGAVGGRTQHLVELSRVRICGGALADGVDFHELSGFNVVIVRPGRKTIFSGCEWSGIDESAALGGMELESVSIVASKRMETA